MLSHGMKVKQVRVTIVFPQVGTVRTYTMSQKEANSYVSFNSEMCEKFGTKVVIRVQD